MATTPSAEERPVRVPNGENWTPAQRGKALFIIGVLANTPVREWQSRKVIYDSLAEFRANPTPPDAGR